MGAYYFLHALYYTCDLYRLYVTIPVTLVAIPFIIPLFDLYEISQCKIIAGSIAFLSLIITFCYQMPFPKWYINPFCFMFFVLPPVILFFVGNFSAEYYYLLSRDMTEKELVSRRQFSSREKVDDALIKNLTFKQKMRNVFKRLTRSNPKSVLDIAATMEISESADRDIEGMDNQYSSSSSSSDDELPEVLKQRQMNIQYTGDGVVKMLNYDGKIVQEISQEEFLKQNPQFARFHPEIQVQPGPPQTEQVSEFQRQWDQNKKLQQQQEQNAMNIVVDDEGKGEFSEKYKERLENDKIRKETQTIPTQNEDTIDEI
uniref:Uncharacterized protein n=1 Tax=Euplotes crassus TaxID=5936 RepID=A0A7S3K781_EUPCR|mmetsp:Transcript_13289/g.13228  ORF Transcript_13289/g.13228 Transcript_13289/m.13228 type:complete len:315 (+) Transcript_13289:673-1617(+)